MYAGRKAQLYDKALHSQVAPLCNDDDSAVPFETMGNVLLSLPTSIQTSPQVKERPERACQHFSTINETVREHSTAHLGGEPHNDIAFYMHRPVEDIVKLRSELTSSPKVEIRLEADRFQRAFLSATGAARPIVDAFERSWWIMKKRTAQSQHATSFSFFASTRTPAHTDLPSQAVTWHGPTHVLPGAFLEGIVTELTLTDLFGPAWASAELYRLHVAIASLLLVLMGHMATIAHVGPFTSHFRALQPSFSLQIHISCRHGTEGDVEPDSNVQLTLTMACVVKQAQDRLTSRSTLEMDTQGLHIAQVLMALTKVTIGEYESVLWLKMRSSLWCGSMRTIVIALSGDAVEVGLSSGSAAGDANGSCSNTISPATRLITASPVAGA
ncbi:hypothetical protein CPB84DRAFT_1743078 [Gymnopilus junonius]|uniref:Uncharacterized protein n=1 Tax=Gymnopilus junonius TaxID=109634 RepID=A0A9P5NYP7_GYMJU|nr:hypothetical protein CPB84DRAFT_1743078 [Gymnopilus junonius]